MASYPIIFDHYRIITMSSTVTENLNIESQEVLITPEKLKEQLPMSEKVVNTITEGRETIRHILDGKDHRLFVVVGPCSIHDTTAALDYARRLKKLADEVSDTLVIVMRVYFEKPRTTVGWKGLINDPYMNDSFCIQDGLKIGRQLLLDIADIGLPTSTEALDPISPQDLISWSAIGARTTESQTHREMASGLSSPVGFKNGTDGGLEVAINAIKSSSKSHRFLGINNAGEVSIIHTRGNQYAHMVLRGGSKGPNYDSVHVTLAENTLKKAGIKPNIMVDTSHANSNKDPSLQPLVMENVANQIVNGNTSIVGLMVESNINHGNQSIPDNLEDLQYGVSITDGCMDWETTEKALLSLRDKIKAVLPNRSR